MCCRVGVLSGQYLFAEPLKEYWEEHPAQKPQDQQAAAKGGSSQVPQN